MIAELPGSSRRAPSPWAGSMPPHRLVATSPAMLFQLMVPLTDVPVAGAWGAAFYCLLGSGAWRALSAGLLAGLAIMIRPNLVTLAAVMGLWYALHVWRAKDIGERTR